MSGLYYISKMPPHLKLKLVC